MIETPFGIFIAGSIFIAICILAVIAVICGFIYGGLIIGLCVSTVVLCVAFFIAILDQMSPDIEVLPEHDDEVHGDVTLVITPAKYPARSALVSRMQEPRGM